MNFLKLLRFFRKEKAIKHCGLADRIFRYWASHVGEEEYLFYDRFIRDSRGLSLELACGGGRLLLRFLHNKLSVEGVESSQVLLSLLMTRAAKMKLSPVVYNQKIEAVDIRNKEYGLIYIPLGSFQLISDREVAQKALQIYHNLLSSKGRLIITTFLPWAQDACKTNGWQIMRDVRLRTPKQRFVVRELVRHDPIEQLFFSQLRSELWDDKDLLIFEQRDFFLRWYSHGELIALLRGVGFHTISVQRSYRENALYKPAFLLFIAEKL